MTSYTEQSFAHWFCQEFSIPDSKFERRLIFYAAPWHARPFLLLLYPFKTPGIRAALSLAQRLRSCRTEQDFIGSVDEYTTWRRIYGGFAANRLRWRLSAGRLIGLARRANLPKAVVQPKPVPSPAPPQQSTGFKAERFQPSRLHAS